MLSDPDEVEGEGHTKMMHFLDIADGSEYLGYKEGVDRYRIDTKHFIIIRHCCWIINSWMHVSFSYFAVYKKGDTIDFDWVCHWRNVANYARFAVTLNLQKIAEMLEQSWTFSIALDMSTHMSTSYLNIRLRLHLF